MFSLGLVPMPQVITIANPSAFAETPAANLFSALIVELTSN
jgi:hypothetical protein